MGDGVKCVRPHPAGLLAWRGEYYEGKCDCARLVVSSPASPICLHINYQLGPLLWKNMAEYKVKLGHPWKPLPPAQRGESVTASVSAEYKVSSLGSSQLSTNHEDHARSDTEKAIYILAKSVRHPFVLNTMSLPSSKVRQAYQDW